ncbi:cell division protein FtsZ [Candidatus Wolfebacteria bacterium]|nr:cell division protein FtsZ [Candidatus Wolfebacteria bacterium]
MARKVQPDVESFARIRVVGVGGSGNNAVNHMINTKVKGVEFISINTDAQDLHRSLAKRKIHIGKNVTRGLGAGGHPETGQRAAEETREEIQEALKGSDMVFVTCGMGGGTGTGAAPVIARIAQELGALTVAIVTKPFSFEGQQRMRTADHGLAELKDAVDAYIVIPNDKLLTIVDQNTTSKSAFAMCDDILRQAVEGVSDIITTAGEINTDFNDIKSVMEEAGPALMGIGIADGDTRAKDAAEIAINSPLLDVSISGAKGVLLAVAGSDDLGILEVQEAAKVVTEAVDADAKIIFGIMKDEKLKKGHIRVIVIATGFPDKSPSLAPERNTSLFSLPRKEQEDERDRIYNSVIPKSKETPEEKKEAEKQETKEAIEEGEEKENIGGAIPSFLRRNK